MVMGFYTDAEIKELCDRYCHTVLPPDLEEIHQNADPQTQERIQEMFTRICKSQIRRDCLAGWIAPERPRFREYKL